MRPGMGQRGRLTAHATFYGLAVLTFGLLATLSGFVSYFAPLYETCRSPWENLLLRISSPGVMLPMAVAGSMVLMAGLSLLHQWRATHHLLCGLAAHRLPAPSRLVRIAHEVGLEDRIECVSDVVAAPFCFGFVRPRVCVPVGLLDMLDDSELRAVLRHESYHVWSRDPLKVWLSRALARGLYFLPLARDLRDSYLAAKEIAADETTAHVDELPLASALVKMLSANEGQLVSPAAALSPLCSFDQSPGGLKPLGDLLRRGGAVAGLVSVTRVPTNATEERIRRLIDGRPARVRLPSVASVVLSLIIVIAIFAASFTSLATVSAMPVSQECGTEKAVARPDMGLGQLDCDLLTPTCQ